MRKLSLSVLPKVILRWDIEDLLWPSASWGWLKLGTASDAVHSNVNCPCINKNYDIRRRIGKMLMKVIITQSWRGLCQLDCHNYGGNTQALIKITTGCPKRAARYCTFIPTWDRCSIPFVSLVYFIYSSIFGFNTHFMIYSFHDCWEFLVLWQYHSSFFSTCSSIYTGCPKKM